MANSRACGIRQKDLNSYPEIVVVVLPTTGRKGLRHLFSLYSGGCRGVGLLLLRVAVGGLAVSQGVAALMESGNAAVVPTAAGAVALASGVALLVGFLTPLAGGLVTLETIAAGLSLISLPAVRYPESAIMIGFVGVVATAIVLIGPGALSVDSRLFGRREIIIPPAPRSMHR
jgi:uncharacterized membrane protein YphA (DoxX/SURF4 family)